MNKDKKLKAMTFDHVMLPPNQQIGQHSQQTWELSYILKGSGESYIGSVREPFHSGDAVLIAPGISHLWLFDVNDVDEDGNIENITITFSAEMLCSLSHAIPEYEPLAEWCKSYGTSLKFSKKESESIGMLLMQMESQPPYGRITLLLQLLASIFENHHLMAWDSKVFDEDILSDDRIKRIEIFLTCNYQRKINLEDLAKYVGMNRSSMCTIFRQKTGMTIFHYLIDLRLSIAQELLKSSDLTIAQCCYKCGFNDIPHFNRTFKRWLGMTPKEYRMEKMVNEQA